MSCGPAFEVVYSARHGQDALTGLEKTKPDLVMTDIRMPVMDGLVLVEKIRERYPQLPVVIISGYQDFQYAQQAFRSGVVDYLLKPVDITAVQNLLQQILQAKIKRCYQKTLVLLDLYRDGADAQLIKENQTEVDLPGQGYRAALIRFGTLPARFSQQKTPPWQDPAKHAEPLFRESDIKDTWLLSGRDEAEFFIVSLGHSAADQLDDKLKAFKSRYDKLFYTISYNAQPFRLSSLRDVFQKMTRFLDQRLIIGENQILEISNLAEKSAPQPDPIKTAQLVTLALTGRLNDLKQELVAIFDHWEKESWPQLWVEQQIKYFFTELTQKANASGHTFHFSDIQLDEAFSFSLTMGELMQNIWQLIDELLPRLNNLAFRIDTREFWQTIQNYIESNLDKPLSLGFACDYLGISQTYLSRLFRKYADMTFNEYITRARINQAMKLIHQHHGFNVQDIATAVGYDNPSYFSKVFRRQTGKTPSEYAAQMKKQSEEIT